MHRAHVPHAGKGLRSAEEQRVDKSMQKSRAGVEDMFNTIGVTFEYFKYKGNFKLLTRGEYGLP